MSLAEIEAVVVPSDDRRAPDVRRALDLALGAWRAFRQPDLADLVTVLAGRLETTALAPRSTTSRAFQDIWLAALDRDPVGNLGPALATLTRALPLGVGTLHLRFAPWYERLAALGALTDPRIAATFVDVLARLPFEHGWSESTTVYDPIFTQLTRLGDIRQIRRLRALVARPNTARQWLRAVLGRALPPVVASLGAIVPPPLEADELGSLDRIFAALGGRPPVDATEDDVDEAALLALVHEAPGDDGPREVLADRWLERGDPRGELVALQLREARGTAEEADLRQVKALLRKHEKTWLGPLGIITTKRRFWRGFLDECTLARNAVASPDVWHAAMRDPALATVRVLHKGMANETHYRGFVASPVARGLRVVEIISRAMLDEVLARSATPFEHLVLGAFAVDPAMLRRILGSPALPRLAKITVARARSDLASTVASMRPEVVLAIGT